MRKSINNIRDNYHLNSKYWQDYKRSLPKLPEESFDLAVGMILGDGTMYRVSREAYIKFEQGYKQKDFLDALFTVFRGYTFMKEPGIRFHLSGKLERKPKSFWFKTFSHESFTRLFDLFYQQQANNSKIVYKKKISQQLILKHLTPKGLAYWIMCDGSLQNDKKTIILHTQGYTLKENCIYSDELNIKFKLNTRVIPHKKRYYVIKIPSENSESVLHLIESHVISSMRYKLPCLAKQSFAALRPPVQQR